MILTPCKLRPIRYTMTLLRVDNSWGFEVGAGVRVGDEVLMVVRTGPGWIVVRHV